MTYAARASNGLSRSSRNAADSSRGRQALVPASRPSSAKIAASRLTDLPRPGATPRRASRAALVAFGRVEDAAHDELRRDGAVPLVLLEPEDDVVAAQPSETVELARRDRRRSRCPASRPRSRTRKRRCLPSPTAARSPSSQDGRSSVTPGFPSPNGARLPQLVAEVERQLAAGDDRVDDRSTGAGRRRSARRRRGPRRPRRTPRSRPGRSRGRRRRDGRRSARGARSRPRGRRAGRRLRASGRSPSSSRPAPAISTTGRWKRSTSRDATIPITPSCQPSSAST